VQPELAASRAAWPGALLRRPEAQLFLTSFLGLYAELLCIRWMPAHVRFLSYFTNFILLASFLGLGVGILSARRRLPLGPRTFPVLVLSAAILIAATKFELHIGSAGLLYYGAGESNSVAPSENALVLPAAFLLVSLLFVCVGRPLGLLLAQVAPPLKAYALDIAGSLAGIVAFFLLSWFEQPPVVWFVGLLAIVLLLSGPTWLARAGMLVPVVVAAGIAWNIGFNYWWSPYYKIGLTPTDTYHGYELNVNESGHQAMLPSDEKEPFYRAPYDLLGRNAFQHVLIIGAGSGSDTAVAIHNGVGHVDAVEIDPIIARLGTEYHPEHPFSDPRVDVHIDDGRSFLRNSPDRYDLIIFALPDSLTLTSQFASLRLESFLFTEQAFKEARDHLTSDGAIVLYNYYREDWLLRKLAGMLETAFGQPPYAESYGGWGRAGVLVNGPRLTSMLAQRPALAEPYRVLRSATPALGEDPNAILLPLIGMGVLTRDNPAGDPTVAPPASASDDWPLMYLRDPALPLPFMVALGMVAAIALGLIFGLAPATARRGFNGHMFFLGAAFMLLETRSLVTFSLLFGSTWLVNSLVFFAILCSVMLAVFLSSRFPVRPSPPLYALLVGALLLAYVLPTDVFLSIESPGLRYTLASVVAFLPVFLANLVFAGSFKGTGPSADVAFASNLLGIMLGGMLEYTSLLIGYQHLLLLAISFYLLSAALVRRHEAATRALPAEEGEKVPVAAGGEW
jgi:SAM-dependent methyltransferase